MITREDLRDILNQFIEDNFDDLSDMEDPSDADDLIEDFLSELEDKGTIASDEFEDE